ncbi:mpv17 / PMP22 family domain-containing protein [Purpureocillium lavendulum]|uniref:Mpv17 / PMP22 family domain-containing protein n=1 Tax=Purpureocillium lavendulum TaxID=1247861 RepID=A0AB34FU60_9HYPO|nr:mpv17 / PMP22 family domain-containing protein [Purpureocillium lavendulum]
MATCNSVTVVTGGKTSPLEIMDVSVVSATKQAVVLNGLSSVVAQAISVYQSQSFGAIDLVAFTQFLVYTALTTPPNHKWQQWLEFVFPTQTPVRPGHKPSTKAANGSSENGPRRRDEQQKGEEPTTLNIANTVAKFLLDQTLGAAVNTVLFICLMDYMKTSSFANARTNLEKDFWPMLFAGYKVWPFVCLLNLTIVPFEYRILVGSTAGLAWGVYINLMYA